MLRHPPIAGFETIVTEVFKKKYGMEMETRDLYRDPLVQEHLSGYLKLLLIDLRKEMGKEIEISVRCSGPDQFGLRGKEWVADGLIDTIIDGNWYSGYGPRPTIDATVAAVGQRGQAFAIAESVDVDPKAGWGSARAICRPSRSWPWRSTTATGAWPGSGCMNRRCSRGIPTCAARSGRRDGTTSPGSAGPERNEARNFVT